jgi:hypothetical protein
METIVSLILEPLKEAYAKFAKFGPSLKTLKRRVADIMQRCDDPCLVKIRQDSSLTRDRTEKDAHFSFNDKIFEKYYFIIILNRFNR